MQKNNICCDLNHESEMVYKYHTNMSFIKTPTSAFNIHREILFCVTNGNSGKFMIYSRNLSKSVYPSLSLLRATIQETTIVLFSDIFDDEATS